MAERCLVCRGDRVVRLRLYRHVSPVKFTADLQPTMEETSRQYPCPECAPTTSEDRVALLKVKGVVAIRTHDRQFDEHVRKSLAHDLVDAILRAGHITFTKEEPDECTMTETMHATLGIVSAATVASMEERIAERQMEVAAKLAGAAADEIRVWGRDYSGDNGNISKGQAVDAVARAFRAIQEGKKS